MTEPEARRCPTSRSANIHLTGTRDHSRPLREGETCEPPVVARTLGIRCRRCNDYWSILRRVTTS